MGIAQEPVVEVDKRRCSLCSSDKVRGLYEFSVRLGEDRAAWPVRIEQCNSCKLTWLAESEIPASATAELERYWQERWGPVYNERQEDVCAMTIAKCEWLEHVVGKRGRLLDMGCGDGSFLAMAKSRGWEVGGIEVAEPAVERARSKVGEGCVFRSLDEVQYSDTWFDVVTLWDVIEHLPDPVGTLRELARLLRPGGQVVISTPNASSLLHRLAHYIYRCTFNRWTLPVRLIYIPEHLRYFEPKTLTDALTRAGFGMVEFDNGSDSPKGLFDNIDALFSANKGEGWTRLPFLKPAIATMLSFSRWLGRPYRLLVVAHKEGDGS